MGSEVAHLKPVLALSQRRLRVAGQPADYDALDRAWWPLLSNLGFASVQVPSSLLLPHMRSALLEWLERLTVDGVILTGGGDLGDDSARDETEELLVEWAEAHQAPLLGVCRGMQHLGQMFGTPTMACQGHVGSVHRLTDGRVVNSFHERALASIPPGFDLVASTERDEVIEDIRHRHLPWRAIMWHPERTSVGEASPAEVFAHFLLNSTQKSSENR